MCLYNFEESSPDFKCDNGSTSFSPQSYSVRNVVLIFRTQNRTQKYVVRKVVGKGVRKVVRNTKSHTHYYFIYDNKNKIFFHLCWLNTYLLLFAVERYLDIDKNISPYGALFFHVQNLVLGYKKSKWIMCSIIW